MVPGCSGYMRLRVPERGVEYGERRMTDRRATGRINGQEVSSDLRERRNMVPSQRKRVRIRTLRRVHVTDQSRFSIPSHGCEL